MSIVEVPQPKGLGIDNQTKISLAESHLVVPIVTLFYLSSPVITHNGVWIIAAQCAA